jgi:hypothetical protein
VGWFGVGYGDGTRATVVLAGGDAGRIAVTESELHALIERLRSEPQETEWLEFKANRYEPQEIGEYLSALANAAAGVQGEVSGQGRRS